MLLLFFKHCIYPEENVSLFLQNIKQHICFNNDIIKKYFLSTESA